VILLNIDYTPPAGETWRWAHAGMPTIRRASRFLPVLCKMIEVNLLGRGGSGTMIRSRNTYSQSKSCWTPASTLLAGRHEQIRRQIAGPRDPRR